MGTWGQDSALVCCLQVILDKALPCLGPLKSQPAGLVSVPVGCLHRLTLSSSRCLALGPHPT